MPVGRSGNFKSMPLNIVGSSVFGIYDKMDSQHTFNMTISDGFLVPYPGYKIGISRDNFLNAIRGRALYESVKLNKIISVFDNNVYLTSLTYNHNKQEVTNFQVSFIGEIQTSSGVVYISENNKPQILISDGNALYVYDQSLPVGDHTFTTAYSATPPDNSTLNFSSVIEFAVGQPVILSTTGTLPTGLTAGITYYIYSSNPGISTTAVELAATIEDIGNLTPATFTANGTGIQTLTTSSNFIKPPITFTPGYITFHDTYFHVAASQDTFYSPAANNTWRLSGQNNGLLWLSIAQTVGILESKPDNTQAVVRFPSKGNMILVMGETVTEYWYDTGAQLFPYQRQNQASIDYGCVSPATVAYMDEIVVWLARNEKSGPVIMFTTGAEPQKITTDGIDFKLSEIDNPEDSQGFLYRKNGHLFYHINFYTDNMSFVVDFTNQKIFEACDQNLNYYSMGQVVWFNNQYFSISKDSGDMFIFDTVFSTYRTTDSLGNDIEAEIPRIRTCDNIRLPSQDYFIANDIGFTIETGMTDYQYQDQGPIYITTQDGNKVITEGTGFVFIQTQDGKFVELENGNLLLSENDSDESSAYVIAEQNNMVKVTPRVDMSVSYDGGASFGSDYPYVLNPIGRRKNKLQWWQGGISNDMVIQFKFWGLGRVVATDGQVNIRQ